MQFLPIDNNQVLERAAVWLAERRNYQWLDFGNGVQQLGAVTLRIMAQKDIHLIRAFTAEEDAEPIGLVALSNIDRSFGTASLWAVLGEKQHARKGYALRACSRMLTLGFGELGLRAINAWYVDGNPASGHIVRHLGFQPIGRQRACHRIDGVARDRFLFDLLAEEHVERDDVAA